MIARRKREIKLLLLKAEVFLSRWDSGGRCADLALEGQWRRAWSGRLSSAEGPLENLAILLERPDPLHGAQIRPGAHAAAAAAFPTGGLSSSGEKF
ncbi:hypothetical protein HispidOSU_008824 [Sigmodon hispidus]